MLSISDEQFSDLISWAIDSLPKKWVAKLDNVAVTYEDYPSEDQLRKLQVGTHQSLFGLYEGIPRTKRGANYNMVLPDKITIFKYPMLFTVDSIDQLKEQIRHTLWHEIAHHYGLDHEQIKELE